MSVPSLLITEKTMVKDLSFILLLSLNFEVRDMDCYLDLIPHSTNPCFDNTKRFLKLTMVIYRRIIKSYQIVIEVIRPIKITQVFLSRSCPSIQSATS